MIHIKPWALGMILSTSATGMELHAATSIKESQLWTYKAILCMDPYHLMLATLAFSSWSTSVTTTYMEIFHKKLVICSDCKIFFLVITCWQGEFQVTWPTVLNSESLISLGINFKGIFLLSWALWRSLRCFKLVEIIWQEASRLL